MPGDSAGSDVLVEYGVHTLAALGADRSATKIATAFDAKQASLRTAKRGRDASDEAVNVAGALALTAEIEVESVVRKVVSAALESVNKTRSCSRATSAMRSRRPVAHTRRRPD